MRLIRRPIVPIVGGIAIGVGLGHLNTLRGDFNASFVPLASGLTQVDFKIGGRSSASFIESYSRHFSPNLTLASPHLAQSTEKDQLHKHFLITNFDVVGDLSSPVADQNFQNALLASIDSQLGILSMLFFQNKLIVTAHLHLECHADHLRGSNYTSFLGVERHDDNSLWIRSTVLNREGELVATVRSRFVKISGF